MTEIERIAAAFETFDLASHDPKWSSWLLDRLFEANLGGPGSRDCDLIRGFDLALHRNDVPLTEPVAHLVREVGVRWVARHREAYEKSAWIGGCWDWALHELELGVGAARAYLFLATLPPARIRPSDVVAILRGLESSPQFAQAVVEFAEDLERPAVRHELETAPMNGRDRLADRIQSLLAAH